MIVASPLEKSKLLAGNGHFFPDADAMVGLMSEKSETLQCFECHDEQHRDSRVGLDAPAASPEPDGKSMLLSAVADLSGLFVLPQF